MQTTFNEAPTEAVEHHVDWSGPRIGFAWDVLGDGKTSLRGGFGISLYNPLSLTRWNPPYFSLDDALASEAVAGDAWPKPRLLSVAAYGESVGWQDLEGWIVADIVVASPAGRY